jgi:hypothetical protein
LLHDVETELWDGRPRNLSLIPSRERKFTLLYNVQIGSGAHQAPYTISTVGRFPGIKREVQKSNDSLLENAEVKLSGAIPPLPINHMS